MLKRVIQIGVLTTLSAIAATASAVTNVSGVITEDTVWTAEGGPYRVTDSIQVAPGATLTIEGGAQVEGAEVTFLSNLLKSHATHFDNTGKGPGITDCNVCHQAKFADYQPLETTTVCDDCHSPGGAFPGPNGLMDPVIGAKANFKLGGVYETDGVTLKEGKGEWCSTCHDAQQSISDPVGATFTYAPNVVGDNSTYGYWVTGHGKSIENCLECHDASKKHFDHKHRTYEIDETTDTVVNGWGDSYRLRAKSAKADENFCLTCHFQDQLSNANGKQSNFMIDGSNKASAHNVHIWGIGVLAADSDYDGVNDARPACVTCHNPHGSKSNKMTRTGELASTPGTTDRTPALNQTYAKPAPGPFSTATWEAELPVAGTYEVFAWWRTSGNLDRAAKYIINHDGGPSTVTVKQRNNGSQWFSLGSYSFAAGSTSVVLTAENAIGDGLVADQVGFDTNGDGIPDIIVDDADAGFSSVDLQNGGAEWPWSQWADGRVLWNQERFILDVSLEESTAGWVRFNPDGGHNHSTVLNYVCNNCHGAIIYERDPFLGPKIIDRYEDRRWVLNDGNGVADVTVSVVDPNDDMVGGSVTIDLSAFGGGTEAMTNNGDGTYSYQLPIALDEEDRSYELPITAVDMAGNVGTGSVTVYVMDTAGAVYLDNEDVIKTYSENWSRYEQRSDAYSGSYFYSMNAQAIPDGDLTATWKPVLDSAGTYEVYVWLNNMTTVIEDATYEVTHSGGATVVYVDQRTGPAGGGWVSLGSFDFDQGETSVVLSGNVIGPKRLYVDAIKLVPVSAP